MKRTVLLPLLISVVALTSFLGCSTPYQNSGFTGGFREAQDARNKFTVAFAGNGYTTGTRAADLCTLRCAEITLGHGFRYFVLVDSRDHIDTSTSITSGAYGGGLMFSTTQSIPKPSTLNTILCFREKPNGFSSIFDAEAVFADLSSKYAVTKKPEQYEPFLHKSKALLGVIFEMTDTFTVGKRIRRFVEGGNAEKAGIKIGDSLVAINGIPITERAAIRTDSEKWQVGDTVELTVERGMKKLKIPVQTVFNNHGITFRTVREGFGNLPLTKAEQITVVEGVETSFTFIPLAEYSDFENPLASIDQFKEIAVQAATTKGANVVHILRNGSEANQYFGKGENGQIGFICGLFYAPPAILGVTYETGTGYEKRRIIRRVLNSSAHEAGLRIGDSVLALNGVDVLSEPAISKEWAKWKVGDSVEVTVARDGKELKIPVRATANELSHSTDAAQK